uniref:Uncharacterized protein n=1 Tax=Aegilops tauschii subsp. strangulata TaxID=200361 RepID=A0A453MJZ2_AEGTS
QDKHKSRPSPSIHPPPPDQPTHSLAHQWQWRVKATMAPPCVRVAVTYHTYVDPPPTPTTSQPTS